MKNWIITGDKKGRQESNEINNRKEREARGNCLHEVINRENKNKGKEKEMEKRVEEEGKRKRRKN